MCDSSDGVLPRMLQITKLSRLSMRASSSSHASSGKRAVQGRVEHLAVARIDARIDDPAALQRDRLRHDRARARIDRALDRRVVARPRPRRGDHGVLQRQSPCKDTGFAMLAILLFEQLVDRLPVAAGAADPHAAPSTRSPAPRCQNTPGPPRMSNSQRAAAMPSRYVGCSTLVSSGCSAVDTGPVVEPDHAQLPRHRHPPLRRRLQHAGRHDVVLRHHQRRRAALQHARAPPDTRPARPARTRPAKSVLSGRPAAVQAWRNPSSRLAFTSESCRSSSSTAEALPVSAAYWASLCALC